MDKHTDFTNNRKLRTDIASKQLEIYSASYININLLSN